MREHGASRRKRAERSREKNARRGVVWAARLSRSGRTHDGRREAGESELGMEKGGRSAAASKAGMRKRGRVARPLLWGRVEIVRERGKAEGARRRNVERTRSGLVRAWGHIHGGAAAHTGEGAFGGGKSCVTSESSSLFRRWNAPDRAMEARKNILAAVGSRQVRFCLRRRAEPRNCTAG